MQKPFALATSVALLLTGCQTKSPAWQKVMGTSRAVGDAEDRDRAYAAELHRRLDGTPHKIVTYEFDYTSRFHGTKTAERTAVVYFDDCNRKQPWWLMADTLNKPVWLPNEPLQKQVIFFARGPTRIAEVHDYTTSRDKDVQRIERTKRPVGTSTLQRVATIEAPRVVEPTAVNARPVVRVDEERDQHKARKSAPPPASNGAAEGPRKNLFHRILGSLDPRRWFRRAA